MKLRTARRIAQVFFFSLFLILVAVADLRYLKGWPASLFLETDPLVGVATAITTRTVYKGLILGLILLIPTLFLGRFFCNWICPYGILHHFIGWAFGKGRAAERERIEANRYRPLFKLKYYLLIAMLAAACFGSLQIGLLDPISLFHRSVTTAILPGIDLVFPGTFYLEPYFHMGAWVIGFILLFLLVMNLAIPRFFCRALCPMGAFLGITSRCSLWRIERNPTKCTDCDLCLKHCEGACDPHTQLRKSECFVCFNCIEDCPHDALSFAFLPEGRHEVAGPELPGRRVALATLMGGAFYAMGRASGAVDDNYSMKLIRPPGSVEEKDFLARCIKCAQCMRVCPTNVLQPCAFESGLEGVWTPILNMRIGYCELNCTLCGQVCPTGAIQRITIEEKNAVGASADKGPVRIGTAFFDRGRCLPWSMETPCVVCQEVCPVSPKAIYTREVTLTRRNGGEVTLNQPYVDPGLCIGCGICEHECPVQDQRAIRVTAVGETRSYERRMLLEDGTAPVPRGREGKEG